MNGSAVFTFIVRSYFLVSKGLSDSFQILFNLFKHFTRQAEDESSPIQHVMIWLLFGDIEFMKWIQYFNCSR